MHVGERGCVVPVSESFDGAAIEKLYAEYDAGTCSTLKLLSACAHVYAHSVRHATNSDCFNIQITYYINVLTTVSLQQQYC